MNADAALVEDNDTAVQTVRILVVEDERIVARSLRRQLTALGYEVVDSVPSGEEAIQRAGELEPHLVLMDINLEGPMDGVEAAAAIRTQFRLPVVYLTAYSNVELLERAKVSEPYGYILKPFEDRELHVVIEMALYKHRMERRQQDREQWFVATLKSIGDAVVATDDKGLITYMNPVAERLTGWLNQGAIGQPIQAVVRLVDKASRQPVESPFPQTLQGETPNADLLLIAKDGSDKAIEACVSILSDENNDSVGSVVVFRDVTERKRLEEQIRQAKQMEAIGRLAGGVAHALNNLMTVTLGYSDLMLSSMNPGDIHYASTQEIKRSATRTVDLTQKLLAFGRKQILALKPVNLGAIINGLAPMIRLIQSGVRLDLSLEPALGLTKVEPVQLEECILTLVRNACEAMPHGGQICIRTANVELEKAFIQDSPEVEPGPYVLLILSDTGMGLSQDAVSHLFEPFYTKETGVGAGLGLAAVYGFVKQCGGAIEVESQPKKGTTYRIYLPRQNGDSRGAKP